MTVQRYSKVCITPNEQ